MEIQRTAKEVQSYPSNIIKAANFRMETCLRECEKSAKIAQESYGAASRLFSSLDKNLLFWLVVPSVLSPLIMIGLISCFYYIF